MEKQQTVVRWLVEQLQSEEFGQIHINLHLIEQAESMFREQMNESFDEGVFAKAYGNFEKYYNETYK